MSVPLSAYITANPVGRRSLKLHIWIIFFFSKSFETRDVCQHRTQIADHLFEDLLKFMRLVFVIETECVLYEVQTDA
jgi:hypothetical protein